MKKINFMSKMVLLSLFSLVFVCSSCSKDDEPSAKVDQAGNIPGLGEIEGVLTGDPFVLPEGIALTEDIRGYSGSYPRSATDKRTKSAMDFTSLLTKAGGDYDDIKGSGYFVELSVKLKNTSSKAVEILFPAGLIVKSRSGEYQNGVLLKKVKTVAPANSTHRLVLLMYCGNASKHASRSSENYDWAVVSNSSLIVDLCNRLADKKINYEEFTQSNIGIFGDQVGQLQSILWDLTDDTTGLTEESIRWINELPKSSN